MAAVVLGANGQLGARCCEELLSRGHQVRGLVRKRSRGAALEAAGVELAEIDLTSEESIAAQVAAGDSVIITANSAAPRSGDSASDVEAGLLRFADVAADAGVTRVVLTSVAETPFDSAVPMARVKRALEAKLRQAPYEHVILHLPPFMECWLALVGSSLPLRGEPFATIGRPSPFLRAFRRLTGTLVERRGLMLVPGSAKNRNAFIAEPDVAKACVAALERSDVVGRTYEVGGPEVLSWSDVARIFEDVLGRRVRILSTPAAVYAVAAKALAPVAPVPAATMALNRFVGSTESDWQPGGGLLDDPAGMTTVREFLTLKAGLPAQLPAVS